MGWRRLGQIYDGRGARHFLSSHASVPFAEPIAGGLHRIWFSPRDAHNRSHVAWLVVDLRRPQDVLDMAVVPALGPGPTGSFDDCGAMMSWITETAGIRRLYYIGWNTRSTVPFHVAIGAADAVSPQDWARRAGPVLDRNTDDAWFCSNPCVLAAEQDWQMWYLSGTGWEDLAGGLSPSYHICHARSSDGIDWRQRGRVAVALQDEDYAIARPSVLRDGEGYVMWFSVRTRTRPYRLGAAVSADGLDWRRAPHLAGLAPSDSGWDSEMIAYPHVFEHAGARWMVYCGNGFGRSGFGLAVWDT